MGQSVSRNDVVTKEEVGMTPAQIGQIQEHLGMALRKAGLPSEPARLAVDQHMTSLIKDLVAVVRRRVMAFSNLITCQVKVDLARSPADALDALHALHAKGWWPFATQSVVESMPCAMSESAEVSFFNVGREISDEEHEEELDLRDGVAVDPYSLLELNLSNTGFADNKPNGTHWKNAAGKWCYARFYKDKNTGKRFMEVNQRDDLWDADTWLAYVPRRK